MKTLKLFNGRGWGSGQHAYVAAYSQADARRVCEELGYQLTASELKVYWSHGCWGTRMDGITPERGLWLQENWHEVPKRITEKRAKR